MASSLPDLSLVAVLAAGLLWLQPVLAAKVEPKIDTETAIEIDGNNPDYRLNTGTLRISDVTLKQGAETTIRAALANARGLKDGYDNSTWELSGGIHIEFNNAVLDADTATVVFANRLISSVHVQGKPARFSHQQKDSGKREGRANTINYDARSGKLRLSGGTWLFDGRNEFRSPVLLYNMIEGSVTNDAKSADGGPAHITIPAGKPPTIPTPRTPDRDTAQ